MPICTKCGNENPLGRLFCGGCGGKLDLSRMTSDEVMKEERINIVRDHWSKLFIVLLIAVVALIGVAAWPNDDVIGKKGTRPGVRRVKRSLKLMGRKSRLPVQVFLEKDINGYFHYEKTEGMKLESFTVLVMDKYFNVRVVRAFPSIGVSKFEVTPKISYDFTCVPRGGGIEITKVSVGHLPMYGPARSAAINSVYKMLAAQKEWERLTNLKEIKAIKGKLTVQPKK